MAYTESTLFTEQFPQTPNINFLMRGKTIMKGIQCEPKSSPLINSYSDMGFVLGVMSMVSRAVRTYKREQKANKWFDPISTGFDLHGALLRNRTLDGVLSLLSVSAVVQAFWDAAFKQWNSQHRKRKVPVSSLWYQSTGYVNAFSERKPWIWSSSLFWKICSLRGELFFPPVQIWQPPGMN